MKPYCIQYRAEPLPGSMRDSTCSSLLTINIMVWRRTGSLQSLVYWPAKVTCYKTWSHQELNNGGRSGHKPKPQWMDNKVSRRPQLHRVHGRVLLLRGRLLCHWSPVCNSMLIYSSPVGRKNNVTDQPLIVSVYYEVKFRVLCERYSPLRWLLLETN